MMRKDPYRPPPATTSQVPPPLVCVDPKAKGTLEDQLSLRQRLERLRLREASLATTFERLAAEHHEVGEAAAKLAALTAAAEAEQKLCDERRELLLSAREELAALQRATQQQHEERKAAERYHAFLMEEAAPVYKQLSCMRNSSKSSREKADNDDTDGAEGAEGKMENGSSSSDAADGTLPAAARLASLRERAAELTAAKDAAISKAAAISEAVAEEKERGADVLAEVEENKEVMEQLTAAYRSTEAQLCLLKREARVVQGRSTVAGNLREAQQLAQQLTSIARQLAEQRRAQDEDEEEVAMDFASRNRREGDRGSDCADTTTHNDPASDPSFSARGKMAMESPPARAGSQAAFLESIYKQLEEFDAHRNTAVACD